MTLRRIILAGLLAMSCGLVMSTARAEEPSRLEKAAQEARAEADKALKAAKEKQRQAGAQLKQAESKLKRASAETKQAAEEALESAKEAYASAEQAVLLAEREVRLGITKLHDRAHAHAHEAKSEAQAKVSELKAHAETAVTEAKAEAAASQEKAERTVHVIQAKAHELVREAVGGTGENARRQAARRHAWRELSSNVDRPEDVPPSVREELRRNAQRIARLRRIRSLASERRETALIARTETLLARESMRHDKKLAALWAAARAKQSAIDRLKAAPDDELDPPEEAAEEEEEQP
jgi:hypothetical protein